MKVESVAFKKIKNNIGTSGNNIWQMAKILSFVLPFTIVLSIFVIRGIYPFGDRSFLFSDMYHQYMPFFEEFMNKIKAGEGLAYSYNVGIGSNFLALYAYYLASPLHWLAFLFPQSHLMEFMSYLIVVKLGLCGVTSFYYLHKHFGEKDPAILFFSTFYALSGFIAAYNWNIMWIDCVVLLPLIVLGLEWLVKEGRCALYCVALALSILTNFYISIMVCIFVVLYFVMLLFTEKCNFKVLLRFVFYSLLAGGMAAALLIPAVCSLLATDFGDISFPEKLESYFSVLDMLARHCMCVETERGLGHWPNIYCGVGVFLLLPRYVLDEKITLRERFFKLAIVGFMLLGFSTNMLDFIWHGLNYPDSLPARQSFIYIFMILTMCYEAYRSIKNEPENSRGRNIFYMYLGAVAVVLFCEKFIEASHFKVGVELWTLGFVTVYALLLYFYQSRKSAIVRVIIGICALVFVTAESGINMYNTSIGTVSRTAYLERLPDYQMLYEHAKEQENGSFFRMEKFARKTKNDGTLAGYPTASVFSSTMNSSVMDLYTRLGMRYSKVYYGFEGATAFTGALLNVDWMFWEGTSERNKDLENGLYTYEKSSSFIDLYSCDVTLPFGYVAPLKYDLPKDASGMQLQNLMVNDLGVEETLFVASAAEQVGNDVMITAAEEGIYYAVITSSNNKKISITGGQLAGVTYGDIKNKSILYLGHLKAGEAVTLKNADESDTSKKITANAYKMDEAVLKQALDRLSENHMENVTFDSTHIKGNLSLNQAGRLILSVPYEKGWSVMINGKKVEPELFGECFMAFDLAVGEYEIAMKYVPEGQVAGSLVSVGCVLVFIAGLLLQKKKQIKKLDK